MMSKCVANGVLEKVGMPWDEVFYKGWYFSTADERKIG